MVRDLYLLRAYARIEKRFYLVEVALAHDANAHRRRVNEMADPGVNKGNELQLNR